MDRILEMTRKALSVKELYGSYIMNSIGTRQKVFDEFMVPLLEENREAEESRKKLLGPGKEERGGMAE